VSQRCDRIGWVHRNLILQTASDRIEKSERARSISTYA